MCDPLSIAGAVMSVGSTVANSMAASKQAKARDQALAAERIRQSGYDRESQALNAQSQDRYTDFEDKREGTATKLGDYFATETPDGANAVAATEMPTSGNSIVTREMAKKSGEAKQFTDQQAGALAELRSFGDLLGETSRMQARDGSVLGQIGGFKRGSANVVPLELEAASQKGAGLKFLGDLLGGAGGIALNAGLTKGPKVASGGQSGSWLFGGNSWGGAPMPAAGAKTASLYPTASGVY